MNDDTLIAAVLRELALLIEKHPILIALPDQLLKRALELDPPEKNER